MKYFLFIVAMATEEGNRGAPLCLY